jgi:outer membrane protein
MIVALSNVAFGDFVGAEIGYATWGAKLSGDIKKGSVGVDFEKDLGYKSSKATNIFWASFEHPVPFLPNIKLQHIDYADSSKGTMSKTLTFDNKDFTLNDKVSSKITLAQTDIIAYWEVLDNWVNLDLGLNARIFDGNIKLDTINTAQHVDKNFDVVIPMLYLKAKFDMPFTGLSLEGDINYISYSNNKVSDIKAGIVYETSYGLGATFGYKKQNITIDDVSDIYGDIDTKGFYGGVFYHF